MDESFQIVEFAFFASYFVLYAIALLATYQLLGSRLSGGAKVAWIFIIFGAPFFGLPAYYLLGYQRLRQLNLRKRERGPVRSRPQIEDNFYAQKFAGFTKDSQSYCFNHASTDLLVNGEETFAAIFNEINKAKSHILVQYYILRSDRLGLELKRLLVKKAREGIKVYVLFDDMGSFWLEKKYVKDLLDAGIAVEKFFPVMSFRRFFHLNYRNHRKIVAIDGVTAFTGGLNFGQEYASGKLLTRRQRRRKHEWRDTHIKITGEAVSVIEETFVDDWFLATEKELSLPERQKIPETTSPGQLIQIFPTGPTDAQPTSILFLTQLINSAKSEIIIASPYFVPDASIMNALELAVIRGVRVRILLPGVADNLIVFLISLSHAAQAQRQGMEPLHYKGYTHQKVILVDSELAAIGTMNFDYRAFFLNFETTVMIYDKTFAKKVKMMLEKDFEGAFPLQEFAKNDPFLLKRALLNLLKLLSPLV